VRLKNVSDPEQYHHLIDQGLPPYEVVECLPLAARFRESVVMGLRMLHGLDVTEMERRFGLTPAGYYGKILKDLERQELLVFADNRLRLTPRAVAVANQILAELV
jgi:oxygen-independent coproporphyrinogen-3 oxidase